MQDALTGLGAPELAMLAVGLGLLFFGWVLYHSALNISGAVFGGAIGLGISGTVLMYMDMSPGAEIVLLAVLVVVGCVAGYLLFHMMEAVAFFILGGALCGWGLVEFSPPLQGLTGFSGDPDLFTVAAGCLGVILGGLLFVFLRQFMIALASAGIGTVLVLSALDWPWDGLPVLVLFPLGAFIQLWPRKKLDKSKDDDDKE